jgi:6-phosphofructokinase 1
MIKRIGILTAGGDCPGLNAVIRAVAKKAMNSGIEVIGIKDGYEGLVRGRAVKLTYRAVSGILTLGGTILGTSNKADPFHYAIKKVRGEFVYKDLSKKAISNFKKWRLDSLVAIGGDGTLTIGYRLFQKGVPIVGVPKTIDNDLMGTDVTFGFDSAVTIATEAIDKLHTTAQSHHRVMVIEVMGRNAGWLALYAGLAGGGDIILIPEIPYKIEKVCERVLERSRKGSRFSIIVVAEGARPFGGEKIISQIVKDSPDPIRLGGVGKVIGHEIEKCTGLETRVTILGHLQRGGSPTPFDRILASRFGDKAFDLINKRRFGYMVNIRGDRIGAYPLRLIENRQRHVSLNSEIIRVARDLNTSFGD